MHWNGNGPDSQGRQLDPLTKTFIWFGPHRAGERAGVGVNRLRQWCSHLGEGFPTPILGTSEATSCAFKPNDSPTSHGNDPRAPTLHSLHCAWLSCRVQPPPHSPALQLQSCLHRLKTPMLRRRLNSSTSQRASTQTLLRRPNATPNPIRAETTTFAKNILWLLFSTM